MGRQLRTGGLDSSSKPESEAIKRQKGWQVGNEIEPDPSRDLTQPGDTAPGRSVDNVEFDQLSAAIRSDASDTDTFFRVLVSKLADSLGDRVQVKREGGLFKRDRDAVAVNVDLSSGAGMVLDATRKGSAINCTVSRPVRGIVVSSKEVTLPEWLDALAAGACDRSAKERRDVGGTSRAARVTRERHCRAAIG